MINQNECRTWYTSSQCRTCYTSKTYIHVGHSIPLASVGLFTPLSVGIVLNPRKKLCFLNQERLLYCTYSFYRLILCILQWLKSVKPLCSIFLLSWNFWTFKRWMRLLKYFVLQPLYYKTKHSRSLVQNFVYEKNLGAKSRKKNQGLHNLKFLGLQ